MAGVYIFPGVNTGPQAGEEAALISTLWYQFTPTSPCNIFHLLLSITTNAKAAINREAPFPLSQYPRTS